MTGEQIDQAMVALGSAYKGLVGRLRGQKDFTPRQVGVQAQKQWIDTEVKKCGGQVIASEARTGVTGLKGGITRFDAVVMFGDHEVWIELQTSDYGSPRKDAQLHGQLIGFGLGCARPGHSATFYKIMADRVCKWTRTEATKQGVGGSKIEAPTTFEL